MITCCVCRRSFIAVTNTHLKTHALTVEAYKNLYPAAELIDDAERLRASAHAKKHNKLGQKRPEVGEKISATKAARKAAGKDYGAHTRGIKRTPEQCERLSATVREAYASGARTHWATGKEMSAAVRKKISSSVKLQAAPATAAREQVRLLEHAELLFKRQELTRFRTGRLTNELAARGLVLKNQAGGLCTLSCSCGHIWTLTDQYLDQSRRQKIFCRACTPKLTTSKSELELYQLVRSLAPDAISGDRAVLGGRELDVLVPSKLIAFELNGLYWHAESVRGQPKHMLWKQQHAYKLGYRLYHVYEDEWLSKRELVEDRVRAILGALPSKADARKLTLVKPTAAQKKTFFNENHLQGTDIAAISYGLADGPTMLACMSFKRTSYVKGGDGSGYELSRFATKQGYNVRGAAGKLLAAFLAEHKPKSLISYADRRWSFGQLYETLGFKFEGFSPPSYWYMLDYKSRTHRSSFMKHELVAQGFDACKTEWEIMQDRGYDRIWDCGTLKYRLDMAP